MTAPAKAQLAGFEILGGLDRLPAIAGQFSGAVLIMGGARCLWDDLNALGDWRHDRMGVNDIIGHYQGTLRHGVTLHPEYLPGWLDYRNGHNYGNRGHVHTHSCKAAPRVETAWPFHNGGGSSGLYACYIAIALGYSRIVLAGMPIDATGHYFDPPEARHPHLGNRPDHIVWHQAAAEIFAGRVRSMSGWTAKILGTPDLERAA